MFIFCKQLNNIMLMPITNVYPKNLFYKEYIVIYKKIKLKIILIILKRVVVDDYR